jgi:hypothetical protein
MEMDIEVATGLFREGVAAISDRCCKNWGASATARIRYGVNLQPQILAEIPKKVLYTSYPLLIQNFYESTHMRTLEVMG